MSDERKKMTVKEFREEGYLQHINRTCLHPLGLALEVVLNKDGGESFGLVWDSRDDPEGFVYEGPNMIDPDKARRINTELETKHYFRMAELGFVVQPDTPEEQEAMLKAAHEDRTYSMAMKYHGMVAFYGQEAADKWHAEELARLEKEETDKK